MGRSWSAGDELGVCLGDLKGGHGFVLQIGCAGEIHPRATVDSEPADQMGLRGDLCGGDRLGVGVPNGPAGEGPADIGGLA